MGTQPNFPVLGLPSGEKEAGQRVDFKPSKFDMVIETKGYLLAWTRSVKCPCDPLTTKTEQPDPNCTLCSGKGWIQFGYEVGTTPDWDKIGDIGDIEKKIITDNSAFVIRGIITSVQAEYNPFDKIGNWTGSSMLLTVRPENKVAYWDRIVVLDSEIAFSQILTADGTTVLTAKYPIIGVNYLRSESTIYEPDADFVLDDEGGITWLANTPVSGTRLGIHYLCHPTFRLTQHPHSLRTTSQKFKTQTPKTPMGDPRSLPIQAMMRYEFA